MRVGGLRRGLLHPRANLLIRIRNVPEGVPCNSPPFVAQIMANALESTVSDEQLDAAGAAAEAVIAATPKPARSRSNKAISRCASQHSRASSEAAAVVAAAAGGASSSRTDLIDLEGLTEGDAAAGGSRENGGGTFGDEDEDLLGLGEGSPAELGEGRGYSRLEIDDEYMQLIMELDLLAPEERAEPKAAEVTAER